MEPTFDVKGYTNAWNTHDLDKVAGFYTDNAEILALPNTVPYRGKEGVKRAIRETLDGIPDVNGDVAWSIQQGNKAAALIHVSGRHTGPLVLGPEQTIEATGKGVRFELGCFWELDAKGKIVKETQVADSATLLTQIGVLGDGATATSPTGGAPMRRSP